jgi:hypothetical protein
MGLLGAGCSGGSGSVERLPPPKDPPKTDPAARAEFLELLARTTHSPWWVESTFTRTTSGSSLRSQITEVNRPPDHVVVGGGGVTGVLRGRALSCSPATGGPVCTGVAVGSGSDPPALAGLTDAATGSYAVRRAPGRAVAKLAARCFRLDWNNRGTSQPYGTRAALCYSADGVPVTLDVDRPGTTDRMVADVVRRAVSDAEIDALVAPFAGVGPVRPLAPASSVVPAVPRPGP